MPELATSHALPPKAAAEALPGRAAPPTPRSASVAVASAEPERATSVFRAQEPIPI